MGGSVSEDRISGNRGRRRKFVLPGEFVGDGDTGSLEIAGIEPRYDFPGGRADDVLLVVKLRPAPPPHEFWWWMERVGSGAMGGGGGADTVTVQVETPRSRLAESIREFRRTLAAANRDYPQGYFADAQTRGDGLRASAEEQRQRSEADRAVIAAVMREDDDGNHHSPS
jgi:hypothetical protein